MTFRILCTLGLFGALAAGQTVYFPLDVGNQWIYRSKSPLAKTNWKVEVTGTVSRNGHDYAVVDGLAGGKRWLRTTSENEIFSLDAETGVESLWYDFSTENRPWNTRQDLCSPTATIPKFKDEYKGPIGEFNSALKVQYSPGGCADAGLSYDIFLPWVGLVSRSSTSFAGPRTWDLVYAKLGSSTVISEGALLFSLALDNSVYRSGESVPTLNARLTLRNTTKDPLVLQFASGQTYDFALMTAEGKELLLWSASQTFLAALRTETFTGESNWMVSTSLADADGKALPPGKYTAKAWLTAMNGQTYSASVTFEIQ